MSFYIYGLRLGGDPECRYVGQTANDPQTRLDSMLYQARLITQHAGRGYGYTVNPDGFYPWLAQNEGNIEAFKIAEVETRAEALATERAIIALVLRLDHRLFNCHMVPPEKRIAWRLREAGEPAPSGSSALVAHGNHVAPEPVGRLVPSRATMQ